MDSEALIDRIYEAALVPDAWESLLVDLGAMVGCDKVFLFGTNQGRGVNGWITNEAGRAPMETFIGEQWHLRNEQAPRTIARGDVDFTVDLELVSQNEIEVSPYYQGFLIPNGMAWGTGTAIQSLGEDVMIFSFHRDQSKGPVPKEDTLPLTALRPHLARASLMSTRLRLEQARAALATLEAVGLPAAALARNGKLRLANDLFQALVPSVVQDRAQRLAFSSGNADQLFAMALAAKHGARTFPVTGPEDNRLVAHLMPVAGQGRDVFSALDHILILAPVQLKEGINPILVRSLFDLTPAEAAIASSMIAGLTLEQIAGDRSASVQTVRSQLKGIMQKTGTNRQVDLVRLLSGIPDFPQG